MTPSRFSHSRASTRKPLEWSICANKLKIYQGHDSQIGISFSLSVFALFAFTSQIHLNVNFLILDVSRMAAFLRILNQAPVVTWCEKFFLANGILRRWKCFANIFMAPANWMLELSLDQLNQKLPMFWMNTLKHV